LPVRSRGSAVSWMASLIDQILSPLRHEHHCRPGQIGCRAGT
jgi:hypothetical protein